MIDIFPPKLNAANGDARLAADVTRDGKKTEVWYSVGEEYTHLLNTVMCDPFLVAVLLDAALNGSDIRVHGPISERLAYNLNQHVCFLLTLIFPGTRRVTVYCEQLITDDITDKKKGLNITGFSGGVDSFATVLTHNQSDKYSSFGIDLLAFNRVGSKLSTLAETRLRSACEKLDLPLIEINSNIDEFLVSDYFYDHQFRNYSCGLILQGKVKKYFYSSGITYDHCRVKNIVEGLAYIEPIYGPLLSTSYMEFVCTGHQYTRIEKTKLISDSDVARQYLEVCVNPIDGGNCSVCEKCVRTQFILELIDKLDNFSQVFDKQKYQTVRPYFVARVLANKSDTLLEEIYRQMKEKHYAPPLYSRFLALVWMVLPDKLRSRAKALFNSIFG